MKDSHSSPSPLNSHSARSLEEDRSGPAREPDDIRARIEMAMGRELGPLGPPVVDVAAVDAMLAPYGFRVDRVRAGDLDPCVDLVKEARLDMQRKAEDGPGAPSLLPLEHIPLDSLNSLPLPPPEKDRSGGRPVTCPRTRLLEDEVPLEGCPVPGVCPAPLSDEDADGARC